MLVYSGKYLTPIGYTDSVFQYDKSFGSMFTLSEGIIVWKSVKQICTVDSTMKAKYMAACEVAKEAVWPRNFVMDLQVVPKA